MTKQETGENGETTGKNTKQEVKYKTIRCR